MASNLKNLSEYKDTPLNIDMSVEVGIVISEWNDKVTDRLARGAIDTLLKKGIPKNNIKIRYVPGTFELALGAKMMIDSLMVDAVICLGCVIQGETRHFDFICNASANAIAKVGIDFDTPVIFGVLTTDNMEQAMDRAGGKHGNKGVEAAITALKMISLERNFLDEYIKKMDDDDDLDFGGFDDFDDFDDDDDIPGPGLWINPKYEN